MRNRMSSGEATGDAGDQYTGLDRFGRVIDQKWTSASNSVLDEYTYTYDQGGNVMSDANGVNLTCSIDQT